MIEIGLTNWLEIDLGAVRNNIRTLQEITKTPVMAVVKANGYGHGFERIAQAAAEAGAAWLGVARIEEALAVRRAGINLPILVLGYCHPDFVQDAVRENISLVVYDPETATAYSDASRMLNQRLKVHVKIDTGMGRLGIPSEKGVDFLRKVVSLSGLLLEGVFSHFARADEPEDETTNLQHTRFMDMLAVARGLFGGEVVIHCANSASALFFPATRHHLVRCGIAIYGLNPSPRAVLPEGFQPALTWKTRLISVKTLPAGHGISYGHRYTTKREERIGVIAAGYADGFRRVIGNYVLVRGQRVSIVGSICMDQSMVQLDGVENAKPGDEVVIIGRQDGETIHADDLASLWKTINYEVVCGITARVPRIYR